MKSKSFIIFVSVIAAAILVVFGIKALSGDPKPTFNHLPADTVRTAITYIDVQSQSGRLEIVFRIAKDTSYLDSIAPNTYKKIERRDSFYYVPVWIAARDSTGKELKDTTGKTIPTLSYQLLDKLLLLQDYNRKFK